MTRRPPRVADPLRRGLFIAPATSIAFQWPGMKQKGRDGLKPGAATRPNTDTAMCEKCTEIDEKIERYLRFTHAVPDQDFVDRVSALIKDLKSEKAAFHPKERQ